MNIGDVYQAKKLVVLESGPQYETLTITSAPYMSDGIEVVDCIHDFFLYRDAIALGNAESLPTIKLSTSLIAEHYALKEI